MEIFISWFISLDIALYMAILTLSFFIVFIRKLHGTDLWVMLVILLYAVTDIAGSITVYNLMPNHWLFNIMLVPQFSVVCITLSRGVSNASIVKLIGFGGIVLLILHIINISFLQGFSKFANFTYIPACAWMAISAYLYLRDRLEQVDINPFHALVAWFAVATLIDNVCTIPILALLGWSQFIEAENARQLWNVIVYLYTFWYFIILFGLIWTKTSLRSVLYSR